MEYAGRFDFREASASGHQVVSASRLQNTTTDIGIMGGGGVPILPT
jgi:hypothetical protein